MFLLSTRTFFERYCLLLLDARSRPLLSLIHALVNQQLRWGKNFAILFFQATRVVTLDGACSFLSADKTSLSTFFSERLGFAFPRVTSRGRL